MMTLVVVSMNSLVLVHRTIFKLHCYLFALNCRTCGLYVFWLHLWQIELLWTQNRAWPSNSDPANERLSGYLKFLHGPQTD